MNETTISRVMSELGSRGRGDAKRIGARASWTPEARARRIARLKEKRRKQQRNHLLRPKGNA